MIPHRELKNTFTDEVIAHLKQHPRPARGTILTFLSMKLAYKPALTVGLVVAALAVSTVGYAIVKWPAATAVVSAEKLLPSGNRVIAIDTTNCSYNDSANWDDLENTEGRTYYYEISQNSAITDEEVIKLVTGMCENDTAGTFSASVAADVQDTYAGDGVIHNGFSGYTITAISPDSISVEFNDGSGREGRVTQTYRKIAADVQVYDKYDRVAYGDLSPGDLVTMIFHSPVDYPTETGDPRTENTDDKKIVAILKQPAEAISAADFYSHSGKDFIRVEPCDTDPSGFCSERGLWRN